MGPGIPAELEDRVFEPFFTTKGKMGTGLGLASSRAIGADHGGQLAYRGRRGGGAEFMLLLPLLSVVPPPRPVALALVPSYQPTLRVLLVDDELAICQLLTLGLPKMGAFEVAVA